MVTFDADTSYQLGLSLPASLLALANHFDSCAAYLYEMKRGLIFYAEHVHYVKTCFFAKFDHVILLVQSHPSCLYEIAQMNIEYNL